MRYAVYMTPPKDSPLAVAAEDWLGRSAFTGAVFTPAAPAAARPEIAARYGFHATMRAPFRLAEGAGEGDLRAAFAAFAAALPSLEATLHVAPLGSFLALLAADEAPLSAAHEASLRAFEPLRAPLGEEERARRRPEALDARARALLDEWGYPHVMERFRFHMTLSGPMKAGDASGVARAARAHFGPLLDRSHTLVFALFREEEAGGPFTVIARQDALDRTP